MSDRTPRHRAELLNFLLTGKLDWSASAQKRFPRDLATRYPSLGAKELAGSNATCQAAIDRGEKLARSLVEAAGYPYLSADREELEHKWDHALLTEFDWIDLQNLTRLFRHAMATAYEDDRRRWG